MNGNTDNQYEVAARHVWQQYAGKLSGAQSGFVAVVFCAALSERAQKALESSAKALGYGSNTCTYICAEGLGEQELFEAIEGNDPLVLIATDKDAAGALSKAYRQAVSPNKKQRIFCRSAVVFTNFEDMLSSDQKKQQAWALLKQLPPFGNK